MRTLALIISIAHAASGAGKTGAMFHFWRIAGKAVSFRGFVLRKSR